MRGIREYGLERCLLQTVKGKGDRMGFPQCTMVQVEHKRLEVKWGSAPFYSSRGVA